MSMKKAPLCLRSLQPLLPLDLSGDACGTGGGACGACGGVCACACGNFSVVFRRSNPSLSLSFSGVTSLVIRRAGSTRSRAPSTVGWGGPLGIGTGLGGVPRTRLLLRTW